MLVESEEFTDGPRFLEVLKGPVSVFKYCDFKNLTIEGGVADPDFIKCFFENVDWYWAFFNDCTLTNVKFENCVFKGAGFATCQFFKCEFVKCRFIRDNLNAECHFDGSKWYDCVATDCLGLPDVPGLTST